MSTSTYILPPQSPLQRVRHPNRSKLLWTVLIVLGAHAVLFGVLLMQGCKRESAMIPLGWPVLNSASRFGSLPGDQMPLSAVGGSADAPPALSTLAEFSTGMTTPHPARQFEPLAAPNPSSGDPEADLTAETEIIVFAAPGDTLSKLAKTHGTTVKAIRAASDLSSDRIAAGQKIRIPRKGNVAYADLNTPRSGLP